MLICLQAGASPKVRNSDGKSAIELAEESGCRELAHLFRRAALGAHESTYKVAILSIAKSAISVGNVDVIAEILSNDPNIILCDVLPDMEGDSCVHFAAALPCTDVLALLLRHQPSIINAAGSGNRSALHFAASSGLLANVQLLLDASADIDAVANDGCTALILASANGHASVTRALLARNCNLSISDAAGLSAIHHAARSCHVECIPLLAASSNTLDARRDPPLCVIHYPECDFFFDFIFPVFSAAITRSCRRVTATK